MNYRGSIKFRFKRILKSPLSYSKKYIESIYDIGNKIGQIIIMPYPTVKFTEVEDLSVTERDTGGFGSTGN